MNLRSFIWVLTICLGSVSVGPAVVLAQPAGEAVESLSRADALRLASERNYRAIAESLDRDAKAEGAIRARHRYVPVVFVEADYDDTAPLGTESRGRSVSSEAGVRWESAYGTRLTASANADRELAGSGSPTDGGALSLSATQPLLKDGWRTGASTSALEAELDAAIQIEVFRQRLSELLVNVETAYWNLAFAQDDLDIKTRSRDRAQAQFKDTETNIKRGILAEGDIYVVEENLVFFEEQLVRANESLTVARSKLAALLQLAPGVALVATDSLSVAELPVPPYDEAVRIAQEHSPELNAEELRAERSRIQLEFDENQTLPTLDVESSVTLNGAGDSFGEPWGQVGRADKPDYRIGITLEVPLFGETDDARVRESNLKVRRQLTLLKDTETRLRFEIRDILTQLDSQNRRLALVKRRVELAELKLQAQMDKYKNGISTLDEVVRFQRDVDSTLIGERRVQVNILVGYARLLEAQGVLHSEYGIEVK